MAHPESGEGLKGPCEWLRHSKLGPTRSADPLFAPRSVPDTVTRAADESAFDIVYRVIPSGRKTPFMEQLAAGDTVRFGGRFGVPVDEGIAPECDRVVGVATGTGIGPLVGFAEAALAREGCGCNHLYLTCPACAGSHPILTVPGEDGPRVELYCGFRDLADVAMGSACDKLVAAHPDRFSWRPIVSKPMACTAVNLAGLGSSGGDGDGVGDGGGDGGDAASTAAGPLQGRVSAVVPALLGEVGGATHFHLVGNGQFVVDFKQGLLDGGIAEGRVTTEKYFNGKAEVDADVAKFVADAVRERLVVAA